MIIKKGAIDQTIYFMLRNSFGVPITGLVYNSAGVICSYNRTRGARVALALITQTVTGSHSDGGFVEVDATNEKGVYRLDLPDAAVASGADEVVVYLEFTATAPEALSIQLVDNVVKDVYDIVNNGTYGNAQIATTSKNTEISTRHGKGELWVKEKRYYVDTVSGNDSNTGLDPEFPKLTISSALTSVTAYQGDAIILINSTGAALVINTTVDVNKAYTHLIGDQSITIKPIASGTPPITLSAVGCHVEGLRAETATTGTDVAISVTADDCQVHNIAVLYSRASAIQLNNANSCILHELELRNPGDTGVGHGILITGTSSKNDIHDAVISGAAGDGIRLQGASVEHNIIRGDGQGLVIHDCAGYGLQETGGADNNHVLGPDIHFVHNTTGAYLVSANTDTRNIDEFSKLSICTETRLAELDAANLPADIDTMGTRVNKIFEVTVVLDGTAAAGGASTITLNGSASTLNDYYNSVFIAITGGTGAGQVNIIDDYVGSTKVAMVAIPWVTAPDDTSDYTLFGFGNVHAHEAETLGTQAKADVNAEIVDALTVDTIAELSQGIPAATPTIVSALMLLYMAVRNQETGTATEKAIYNDAGTKITKGTLSDDGTTFTKAKLVSGA